MSRSSYSDDYGDDFPGQADLYRANVERSIRSKQGQARLRELHEALLAMPVKELQADIFAEESPQGPQVCALGQWAVAQCQGDMTKAHALVPRDEDDYGTWLRLKDFCWPKLVVFEVVYMNDDEDYHRESSAQRYQRVLTWVEQQILNKEGTC
jgi:hypothetical protein